MLSVRELENQRLLRAQKNHDTYKHIYNMCTNQIRRQNSTGNTCLLYAIPSFIVGRTPFTHSHAIRYTVEKLQRGGFRVTTDPESPGIIFVEWGREATRPKEKPTTKQTQKTKEKKKKVPKRKKIEEPLSVRIARLQSKSIMNA